MEIFQQIIAASFGLLLVVGCLLVLWAIIRFSVISPQRTKGAKNRLRSPDADGVTKLTGVNISPSLVEFYRTAPAVMAKEFQWVDERPDGRVWPIGEFVPLTARDAQEHRTVGNVPGVPLATDMDKGYYYLDAAQRIWLSQTGGQPPLPVADTVEAFVAFKAEELPEEED